MSVPDGGTSTSGPFGIGDPGATRAKAGADGQPIPAASGGSAAAKPAGAAPQVGTGQGGALSPTDDPTPTARTNPYDDPDGWGTITLAGSINFPGIITDITGADREWEWDVKKGTGKKGATATSKGEKVVEALKITCQCPRRSDFDELFAFRDAVCPPSGEKPATFSIQNQVINFNKITRVSIKKFGQPKPDAKGNKWSCEFDFIENNPSSATKTGPQDPAKPDGGGAKDKKDGAAPATPKDAADKEIDDLVKKAQQP